MTRNFLPLLVALFLLAPAAVMAQPGTFIDLGTLNDTSPTYATADVTNAQAYAAGQIRWYRFVIDEDATNAAGKFLDFDTTGTGITDTEIGLYTNTGALVASDDDDGDGAYSALTFGQTTPTRGPIGTGLAANGRDGQTVVAGTYWLAVSAWPTTHGTTGWNVTSTATGTGNITIFVRTNVVIVPPGDPEINVQRAGNNLATGSSFSVGLVAAGSPVQTTLTIQNIGATQALNVTSIAVSGTPNNCSLAFGALTPASPIAAGGSATFTVDVTPAAGGNFSGTFIIANNDANEPNYTLTVTGSAAGQLTLTDSSQVYATADVSTIVPVTSGQVRWYTFNLPISITGAGAAYLDLDTEGSTLTDSEIAIYTTAGALVATDDDDGSNLLSALSFGATTTNRGPAVTGGTAGNGRDGALAAGTYFIAVVGYNATFGAGFSVTTTSTAVGNFNLNLRFYDPATPVAPVLAAPVAPAGTNAVLLTEIATDPGSSTDEYIELTNVGAASVSLANWSITVYDGSTTPLFTIPLSAGTLASGARWVLCDNAAATAPAYSQSCPAITWGGDGGVVLRDQLGRIRDAIFWGSINYAAITQPVSVGSAFTGANAATPTAGNVLERAGTADTNTNAEWGLTTTDSIGAVNSGLTLPFSVTSLAMSVGGTDPNFTGSLYIGDSLALTLTGSDTNPGDTLSFTITENASSTISAAAAGFSTAFPYAPAGGTSPHSVSLAGIAAAVGVVVLDVVVSDGTLSDSYQVTITILGLPEIEVFDAATGGTSLADAVSITGVTVGVANTVLTFRIENQAAATLDLTLPATPVSTNVSVGTGTINVTIGQPGTLVLAPGASTTFTITLSATASATGNAFTVEVDVASDDADENPFDIDFSGTATFNSPPRGNPETTVSSPVFTGTADSGPFSFLADPGTTVSSTIIIDDADADDVQVVSITGGTQAGITPSATLATLAATQDVDFTGSIDPAAAPGVYTWTINVEDDQTPAGTRAITVNITVNNVAPDGFGNPSTGTTGGDGTVLAQAYTRTFNQTATVAATNIFTVTDANTGQALSITSSNRTGGATATTFPFTGQFAIAGAAGSFTVSVSTVGALVATDVGTHEHQVVITDGTASITVFVTITVAAQTPPTYTPNATGVSIGQGGVATAVDVGTVADAQDAAASLVVTATTVPTGITVSAIAVDAGGVVTCTISVTSTFTPGAAAIGFTVTDSISLTDVDTYNFTVVANTLPTITAGTAITMGVNVTLTARTIATVSDVEDAAGTLTVATTVVPPGITIGTITNTTGTITADVTSSPTITAGVYNVTLQVTDSQGATNTANLQITISTATGGGGGGDDGGGGCVAGNGSSSWMAMIAVLGLLGLAIRLRRVRA